MRGPRQLLQGLRRHRPTEGSWATARPPKVYSDAVTRYVHEANDEILHSISRPQSSPLLRNGSLREVCITVRADVDESATIQDLPDRAGQPVPRAIFVQGPAFGVPHKSQAETEALNIQETHYKSIHLVADTEIPLTRLGSVSRQTSIALSTDVDKHPVLP